MSIGMKKPITIISSNMIRPADETPRKTLWLSRLDMMSSPPYTHTRLVFVYPPLTTSLDTKVLRECFAKALVPFYPMAGRLKVNKNNGRYEIDCNAKGAVFMDAETDHTLADLGSETNPNMDLIKEAIPICDYSKGLSNIPLLMVQLTRFKCGGVCLGFLQHHHVGDGVAYSGFVNSWARLTKGLDITFEPVHDRFSYVAPRNPPQVKFLNLHYLEPPVPPLDMPGSMTSTINSIFELPEGQIKALKQEAMSSKELSSYQITTFTVLAGHVWRSVCKARKLTDDQDVKLHILVNGRRSLKLPSCYVGNAMVFVASKAKAGDVMHKPLWYAISKVSEAVKGMKEPESFRSVIDYIESQPSLEPFIRGGHTSACPNLSINFFASMQSNKSDFGWGTPKSIRHGGIKYEGHSVFCPGGNGDGNLLLSIKLFTQHMALFGKFLYESGPPSAKL